MQTYFLEYVPLKVSCGLMLKDYDIFALTPKAVYWLDVFGVKYFLPEDFHYPERLEVDQVFRNREIPSVFILHYLEREETERYWIEFLNKYKRSANIDKISYIYYGEKLLLSDMLRGNNEF